LPIIVIAHIFFLVYKSLTDPNLGVPYAFKAMLTVQLIGQYFLPFGIWLAFAYKDIFKRAGNVYLLDMWRRSSGDRGACEEEAWEEGVEEGRS